MAPGTHRVLTSKHRRRLYSFGSSEAVHLLLLRPLNSLIFSFFIFYYFKKRNHCSKELLCFSNQCLSKSNSTARQLGPNMRAQNGHRLFGACSSRHWHVLFMIDDYKCNAIGTYFSALCQGSAEDRQNKRKVRHCLQWIKRIGTTGALFASVTIAQNWWDVASSADDHSSSSFFLFRTKWLC